MKKKLFITFCLIIVIITISIVCKKLSTMNNTESTVNENISLAVYSSSDYTAAAYKTSLAQLDVTIEKINAAGENKVVWEKAFDAKYLSQYPSIENALKQNVGIKNILAKDEYLLLKYNIIYDSEGSKLQMENNVIVDNSSKNISIDI